ncbi:carboxyl-terminal-processing peptidase 1, chloroplastic [Dorcoceras hygrometricum]|uniref:Carboxyl-terminal-processing peptidase 1, chloroplastic n=1 Tax=Dorcoceras hygrometricum TaxID=472368 RepID=A0A2Z7BD38_9LAMI|nr:carboxyl-terminal-processing peptidase 1, chloroplastic [Dorcoceras hygrometricum]
MVKRLATSCHDPLGITDSACKNQFVVVSIQYGPFNTYIPIGSTTIGKSRVARDPIAMHTSWRSNSDIASVTSIGYPRMKASGESSTTKHRLLHASGPHPIPPPNDPKGVGKRVTVRRLSCRVSMTFRVVRTNQYNQDLGLIHSTNSNHLESPNEGSSIDHQVTIHLHAQNITMLPTNETCKPPPPFSSLAAAAAAAVRRRRRRPLRRNFVPALFFEENPIVLLSSGLLVQFDEGISDLVVDRIGVSTAIYREAPGS